MYRLAFLLPFFTCLLSCQSPTPKPSVMVEHYLADHTKNLGLPFSDAVIVGDMIYLSGSIGTVPGTINLVEGGIRAEAKQIMENIRHTLRANDATMDDIIKCTVMIDDISEWGIFNEEYVKFFPNKKPARSAFGAEGLALGAAVEVECIACRSAK